MTFDAETLSAYGLPGLFLVTFFAGSFLPFPSDALLAALVYKGVSPLPAALVATVGNTLGALTLFWVGRLLAGGRAGAFGRFLERRAARDPEKLERAKERLRRYGAPLLLLSWIPLLGDALVIAAGYLGTRFLPCLLYVTCGKALRFGAVVLSALVAKPS